MPKHHLAGQGGGGGVVPDLAVLGPEREKQEPYRDPGDWTDQLRGTCALEALHRGGHLIVQPFIHFPR